MNPNELDGVLAISVVAAITDEMAGRIEGLHEAAILRRLLEQPGAKSTILAGTTLIWFDIPSWYHAWDGEQHGYGPYADVLAEFLTTAPADFREHLARNGEASLAGLDREQRGLAAKVIEGPFSEPEAAELIFAKERALLLHSHANLVLECNPNVLVYDDGRYIGHISLRDKEHELITGQANTIPALPGFVLEEFPNFIQPRVDVPENWTSEQVMIRETQRVWTLKDLLGGAFVVHPDIAKLKVFVSEGKWGASTLLRHVAAVLGVQIVFRSKDFRVETSRVHTEVAHAKTFVVNERKSALRIIELIERFLIPTYVRSTMESFGLENFHTGEMLYLTEVGPEGRHTITDALPPDVALADVTLRFAFGLSVGCRLADEAPETEPGQHTGSISYHTLSAIPEEAPESDLKTLRHYCVDPDEALREHGAVLRY